MSDKYLTKCTWAGCERNIRFRGCCSKHLFEENPPLDVMYLLSDRSYKLIPGNIGIGASRPVWQMQFQAEELQRSMTKASDSAKIQAQQLMDGQVDFRNMRKTLDQAFANSKRGASKRKRLFHLDMQERVKRGVNDVFEQIEMDIDDKLDEEGMSNELILNAEKAAPGTTPAIKIPVVTPIKPPPVILETPLTTTPASNASVMDQTTFKPKQDRPHNSNSARLEDVISWARHLNDSPSDDAAGATNLIAHSSRTRTEERLWKLIGQIKRQICRFPERGILSAAKLVVAAQDLYMSLPSVAYIVDLAMDDTPIADDFVPEDSLKRVLGQVTLQEIQKETTVLRAQNFDMNRSKLIQLWYRHLCLNFTPSAPAVSAFAAAAPLNMPGLISTDQAVLQDFIAEFKTMTNEDRVAANAEQRATSMRVSNENLLRKLRQGAQRRLDVALLRCCQDWFSAPAKKKKAGSAPTLLGLCTKWWREVKEILLWRAQLPGVRVEARRSSNPPEATWEKATVISWDLAASKVALSFDADPETKAEEVTVSATTVRLEEGMSLIPDAEEDSRRIERHKLMETALENRNVLGGSAAELCKLIDGPATGPQPQSTHNAFVRADAIRDKVTGKKRGFTLNDLSQVVQRAQKNSASGASKNKDLCQGLVCSSLGQTASAPTLPPATAHNWTADTTVFNEVVIMIEKTLGEKHAKLASVVFWQLGLLNIHSSFPNHDLVSKYNAWAQSNSINTVAEDAFKDALGLDKNQLTPFKSGRTNSSSSSGILDYVLRSMSQFNR